MIEASGRPTTSTRTAFSMFLEILGHSEELHCFIIVNDGKYNKLLLEVVGVVKKSGLKVVDSNQERGYIFLCTKRLKT